MIILIAAMSKKRVIGYQNRMPWHIPSELAHFRTTTSGQTVLMGRKTFEAIGGLLPNRKHIIVTSKPLVFDSEDVTITNNLITTLETWKEKDEPLFVIGGGQIYQQALPYADAIILSIVKGDYEGDTYFPLFSDDEFQLMRKVEEAAFTVYYYARKK